MSARAGASGKMDVVGRQHGGVHGAAEVGGQVVQVELIVGFTQEADRAIVAALDAAPRDAENRETGAAWNG